MSKLPDVVWLNTSPSLLCFAQPLICQISRKVTVALWEYHQTQDEASSLDVAVELLHDYLQSCSQPVHLVGHSTGGLLGLSYSRKYPEKVKSLTLLAVGVDAAVDWQAHYYTHLPFLSRQKTLNAMVYNLFGYQDQQTVKRLVRILEQDLNCSLSPHSVFQRVSVPPSRISVPLMVCGSLNDIIVEPEALHGWRPYLKEGDREAGTRCDRLWECPQGRHFFHFSQPQLVAKQIFNFWDSQRFADVLHKSVDNLILNESFYP
jgi:pimeloyl-ACP methyl ester carboxylesterase